VSRSRIRILLVCIALVALCAITARYAGKAMRGNDFGAYYAAGHAVLTGENMYTAASPKGREYLYPPTLAVLLAPLTLLSEPAAAVPWTLLSLAAIGGSLALCARAVGARGREARCVALLSLLCVFRPLNSELGNGQANHFVLLCLALMVWLFAGEKKLQAGLALAGGICLKVTPALVCGYLLFKREWRALAGTALGLIFLLGIVPSIALGPRGALEANLAWVDKMARPYASVPKDVREIGRENPGHAPGNSLRPMVYRLLTWTDAASHWDEPIFLNVASLTPEVAENVYRCLALVMLVIAAAAWSWRRAVPRERFLLEISLCLATMLLIAPVSRKAHFITAMIPFAVCVALYRRDRDRKLLRWLVPSALLFNVTSSGFLGRTGSVWALALGLYFLAGLLLWAGLVALNLRRADGSAPGAT
jgi:hypothetical protein